METGTVFVLEQHINLWLKPMKYLQVKTNFIVSSDKLRIPGKHLYTKATLKLHGLSPRENYTDRATAACRRSDCQLLRIEGATWSA
jgi:hypothetical protein